MNCSNIPVLIIGGGPAGTATALQLAERGIPALILEARVTPQMRPGETIPPQAGTIFQRLRLQHLLTDPTHFTCYGNRAVWGSPIPAEKLFYYYTRSSGWHINRQLFEKQLQQEVSTRGVQVQCGCYVQGLKASPAGWDVSYIDQDQQVHSITCAFIVDATGRRSRIARHMGVERRNLDTLVGLYTIVPYTSTIQQYTFIEAVENGWWYMAPLTAQQMVLTYMTDADLVSQHLRTANGFSERFSSATFLNTFVSPVMPDPVIHHAATGYLRQRHGNNWLAVGDAAFAYDPVSSHGIISAMESGYYAGHAIADHLGHKPDALPAYDHVISQAFSVYMHMHAAHYAMEARWKERAFWERRRN